jgi:arabinose-5-phosphate isomerase
MTQNLNPVYLKQAREVLKIEADTILAQIDALGEDFSKAVELILQASGRVVVTGMGKSGLIGRKISATLSSTGTPSFFLHPAEGIHGDLGMVTPQDVVIAISDSGQSDEIMAILPTLKILGTPIISFTGSKTSFLAQNSNIVLHIPVEREACPLGVAPTASTTVHMAMGDALAVVLMQARNFTSADYALFHPGGALGRKLLLTVERLMYTGDKNPLIHQDKTVREAVITMTTHGNHGAAVVIDDGGLLVGIVTDGDLRRIFEKYENPLALPIKQVMIKNPRTITKEKMAAEAMHIMEEKEITVLPVVDAAGYPMGIIQLHDIIRGLAGLK